MKSSRILYAILFLMSLLLIYFYGGKLPYMLFYTTLVLPFISFAYILIIYFRFKYNQEIDKKFVMKGDKVNFLFSVNNEDFFLYPYIKVTFCSSETIFANQFQTKCFSLLPFEKKTFSFGLECKYRGQYEVGLKSFEIRDFLGIFRLTYHLSEKKYITVYPRIVYLESLKFQSIITSETQSFLDKKYEDMTMVSDIRKFAQGDSLKKVHWKLSAKLNNLMVKNYQCTSETSVIALIDLRKNLFTTEENIILEDKIIESAVAVIYYCLSHWIPVNLVYYKDEVKNIDAINPLHFDSLYKILSKVPFSGNINVKDILDFYINNSIKRNSIIIFTSNLNYDLYDEIYKSKVCGYDISVIYISSSELNGIVNNEADDIISHLPEMGVQAYKIGILDDIKQILEC